MYIARRWTMGSLSGRSSVVFVLPPTFFKTFPYKSTWSTFKSTSSRNRMPLSTLNFRRWIVPWIHYGKPFLGLFVVLISHDTKGDTNLWTSTGSTNSNNIVFSNCPLHNAGLLSFIIRMIYSGLAERVDESRLIYHSINPPTSISAWNLISSKLILKGEKSILSTSNTEKRLSSSIRRNDFYVTLSFEPLIACQMSLFSSWYIGNI